MSKIAEMMDTLLKAGGRQYIVINNYSENCELSSYFQRIESVFENNYAGYIREIEQITNIEANFGCRRIYFLERFILVLQK